MLFFLKSIAAENLNRKVQFFSVVSFVGLMSWSVTGRAAEDEVTRLVGDIFNLAKENSKNTPDELPTTRSIIEPLIRQLDEVVPDETLLEQLPRLQGAWQEVWSDDREPEAPGTQVLRDAVYQVIFKNGTFYNFAERRLADEKKNHAVLKGQYGIKDSDPRYAQIEFVRLLVKDGGLPKFYGNAFDFASAVEKNVYAATDVTDRARAPRGPIGAKGELRNIYLSDDLRIVEGANYSDGRSRLYILSRSTRW